MNLYNLFESHQQYQVVCDGTKKGIFADKDEAIANAKSMFKHEKEYYHIAVVDLNTGDEVWDWSKGDKVDEGLGKDMAKLIGIPAVAGAMAIGAQHYDDQQPHVQIGDKSVRYIANPGWGRVPDSAMTVTGKDGKQYRVWRTTGKGSGHVWLAAPAEEVKEGVAEGLNEFAPDGFNGGDDGEEFNPRMAKMAYEAGIVKGASLADGATLERAMAIDHWDSHDGGMYKQYFAKGFKQGRMNKIKHDNKQYNLNLKLMKDGSIRHGGEQGVAESSDIERKIHRTQALIQDYYDRSRNTRNDIKRDHYIDMARQLEYELEGMINDANEHERASNEITRHDEEPSNMWEQGVAEGWKDKAAAAALVGTALASNAGFDDAVKVGVDNANKSRQQVLAQYEKDKKDYEIHKANLDKVNAYIKKEGVAEGELDEKSVSQAQFRTMAAAAHNPEFAKKVGISSKVAKEFHKADKGANYKKLPKKVEESRDMCTVCGQTPCNCTHITETRAYYNVIGTPAPQLRSEFGMRKDRNGWFLGENVDKRKQMAAFRAFGAPKLKEFNLAAFSGSAATKGEDNIISPVGSGRKGK